MLLTCCCIFTSVSHDAIAQEAQPELPDVTDGDPSTLEFAFEGAPWKDVVKWLAESNDLALHVSDIPNGTFTYSDKRSYTSQKAIDRVNLFLLPQGFTLVRSGGLLSLINFNNRQSKQQLDALATLVTPDQLDELNPHEVVKCIFDPGELDVEDAIEELMALNLMTTPATFPKTNRILVTDTASKLRAVRSILDSFEPRKLDNGTVVKSFTLEHVDAEDILVVARPHLGLATGEMIGIDVSLSSDIKGKQIFATGVDDKIKLIENLVLAIDQPRKLLSTANGEAVLQTYTIEGGNTQTIYNVLLTLLAGQDEIRLTADNVAGTIVALAPANVHEEIAATVQQLQASETEFEVIPLKTIDPYFAISLLEEMLDLNSDSSDTSSSYSSSYSRDRDKRSRDYPQKPEPTKVPPPKIDADPANMRLFVRGKRFQIDEIKAIVAGLDEGTMGNSESSDEIRIFPLRGKQAEQMLTTAAKFWKKNNPVFFYPQSADTQNQIERVVSDELTIEQILMPMKSTVESSAILLSKGPITQAPAIRCQLTPRGLLLQSEDTQALDDLEELLRTLSGPVDTTPSPPVVFYLKYTRASDAIQMLAELLDGGEAAKEAEGGSLVNGYVSSSGSFLSSIVTAREGTITMMSGSITVVADTRLNRLIAQGSAGDIQTIESYLKIVDKDNSITAIETYGTSQIIELEYARASEVAVAIREAYGSRVTASSAQSGAAGSQTKTQTERPEPPAKETKATKQTPQKPSASQAARDMEPKMTLTVHELSNSLIVTAPRQLFLEVQNLAMMLDERSKQTVRILNVSDNIPLDYLQQFLDNGTTGTRVTSSSSGSANSSKSSKTPKSTSSPSRK